MGNKICPKCKGDNICFCGLVSDGKGGWLNKWECFEKDCEYEWTEEITSEQKRNFE